MMLSVTQLTLVKTLDIEECNIGEDATKELAKACERVARHYPVAISQRAQDWAALATCVGMIGQTQVRAYFKRKARERGAPKAPVANPLAGLSGMFGDIRKAA